MSESVLRWATGCQENHQNIASDGCGYYSKQSARRVEKLIGIEIEYGCIQKKQAVTKPALWIVFAGQKGEIHIDTGALGM